MNSLRERFTPLRGYTSSVETRLAGFDTFPSRGRLIRRRAFLKGRL